MASERREPDTGGTDAWLLGEQAAQGLLIGVHPTPCGAGGFCALVRTWGVAPGPNNPSVVVIWCLRSYAFLKKHGD